MVRRDFLRLARAAARAADDKKASDILILDVRKESDIADYLVIAGADSSAQMRAVSDSVEEQLHRRGVRVLHRDGRPTDRWVALDYGGLVVHLLVSKAREFYRLELLWEKARKMRWK